MPRDQTIRCWGKRAINYADCGAIEVALREALRQGRENDRNGKTTVWSGREDGIYEVVKQLMLSLRLSHDEAVGFMASIYRGGIN